MVSYVILLIIMKFPTLGRPNELADHDRQGYWYEDMVVRGGMVIAGKFKKGNKIALSVW